MSDISFFSHKVKDLDYIQDFFQLDYQKQKNCHYWSKLAEIIEKFDQIVQIQKKQIQQMVEEIYVQKSKYIHSYIQFKYSLQSVGENKIGQYIVIQHQKIHKFFQKQRKEILEIITFFTNYPEKFAGILNLYDNKKKYNFNDFALNIVNNFYSFQHQYVNIMNEKSEYFKFIDEIFKSWNYDIENYKMQYDSIFNDILLSSFKNPIAECYVQKIAIQFIQKLEQMPSFIFDLQIIKREIQSKKISQNSFHNVQKQKGLFAQLRETFSKVKTDEKIQYGRNSYSTKMKQTQQVNIEKQALQIQQYRRDQFMKMLRFSLDLILKEQIPSICKLLLRKFKKKLDKEIKIVQKKDYSKHFCCLLITNWILLEIHYKFTMTYNDKQMSNKQLQNMSLILKAITSVFQQQQNSIDRILFYSEIINEYRGRISDFYHDALQSRLNQISQQQINIYQIKYMNCIKIFSLNDLKIFCDLIRSAIKVGMKFDFSQSTFEFLNANNLIYTSKTKVKFREKDYESQNIYFVVKIHERSILHQIMEFYLGKEYLINQLLPISKKISVLDKQSKSIQNIIHLIQDLTISQTLELNATLQYFKKLNSKEILSNLNRLQYDFHEMTESNILNQEFQRSFQKKLKINLIYKSEFIRHKNNICSEISLTMEIIDIYSKKIKTESFYKNLTDRFIRVVQIKVYIGIQYGILEAYRSFPEYGKKLHISNIINSKKTMKQQQKQSILKNNLLEESYKLFENVNKVIQWIAYLEPTKKAFFQGKKVEQFNSFFKTLCDIICEKMEKFVQSQKLTKKLDTKKFKDLIIQRIGEILLFEMNLIKSNKIPTTIKDLKKNKQKTPIITEIEKDKIFLKKLEAIDQQKFYQKQLANLNLQEFLFQEAIIKFNQLDSKTTAKQKILQFDMLIKMIFSIISLSIQHDKITAEIITPIIQYIILKSKFKNCYKNLYIIQCLLGDCSNSISYILTLWDSALSYLWDLTNQELDR